MAKHKELSLKEREKRLIELIAYANENKFSEELIKTYQKEKDLVSGQIAKDKSKRKNFIVIPFI